MASVKTNKGREKLAKAHAGIASLPKVSTIVFGSGGTEGNGTPRMLTGNETALFNQVISKTAMQVFPDPYTSRYSATINADIDNLIGTNINEAGLIDSDGDLVAMKTFTNKGLDTGTVIEFDYDAEF
ncbi:phage tail protein [Chengkuizengella sp. SCS-71B]|uniref:phage tail-collar fiber domain-containing protein n=1 Tax=Chengkuizengella sp. SCS-71B TaxID=3115290 RepID=UPI0032C22E1D